jgi:LysM repeat protein
MRPLSAHLRDSDEHDRLAMHLACPVCREQRLAGPAAQLTRGSQRFQAMVAIGALGLAAFAPTSAVAADPDQEFEGDSAEQVVNDPTDPDPINEEPASDQGTIPSAEPEEEASASDTTGAETGDDLAADPAAPVAAPEEAAADPDAAEVSPPAETSADAAPSAPEPVPAVTSAPAQPEAVASTPQAKASAARPQHRRHASDRRGAARTYRVSAPPAPTPAPVRDAVSVAAPTAHVTPARRPVATRLVAHRTSRPPARGDHTHTVTPGDSLWSIAKALRGKDASNAEIAREVNRLWNLNADRIATGNPDLLLVGTRLKLQ